MLMTSFPWIIGGRGGRFKLKRSDRITTRAELIIKSAAPRVFVWSDYLFALFVDASCVVRPPHIQRLA
jgi:hypothetical protein